MLDRIKEKLTTIVNKENYNCLDFFREVQEDVFERHINFHNTQWEQVNTIDKIDTGDAVVFDNYSELDKHIAIAIKDNTQIRFLHLTEKNRVELVYAHDISLYKNIKYYKYVQHSIPRNSESHSI